SSSACPSFPTAKTGGRHLGRRLMHIAEEKHFRYLLLPAGGKAAARGRYGGVLERAKEPIPDRKVCVILAMVLVLVMHPVRLRTLYQPPQPSRGADIPVIEVFCYRCETGIDRCGL